MKSKYALLNGTIYTGYSTFTNHALIIESDRIKGCVPADAVPSDYEQVNVGGAMICPGLIDLQIYGTGNDLFSAELSEASLVRIDEALLKQGCTSYMLTLATNTLAVFGEAILIFRKVKPAVALGLHLEGPFLNRAKRGAHPEELIQQATLPVLQGLMEGNEDVVKMMTIAPELMDEDCLQYLQEKGLLLTAGHSAASYREATAAFDKGVPAVTHLWNAMSPLHHRDVGLPGAVFNHSKACASIIVDGIHVDYEAVKISKEMMGERLFLITDAVATCDKSIYKHILKEDHFVLPDGTLSGSALSLLKAVSNCVVHAGIALDEAIRMATLYPARLLNRTDIGNLDAGSLANVLIFKEDYSVQQVVFEGKMIL